MLRTILVPLDGSALAEHAIPYARVLAGAAGARLTLVQVVAPLELATADATFQHRQDMREAETGLARFAWHARRDGQPAEWYILHGDPARAIVDRATHEPADLILMSTHGRTGPGRWVHGSVADEVLRKAPTPVMLVPALVQSDWSSPAPFRIVVPLDGSTLAEAALRPAAEVARAMQGEIVLAQAVVPPSYSALGRSARYAHYDRDAELRSARTYLERLAETVLEPAIRGSVYVDEGEAHNVVFEAVRLYHAHMIALATHGRGGLSRLLLGSVAEAILREATVPLLMVRTATAAVLVADDEQPAWRANRPEVPAT